MEKTSDTDETVSSTDSVGDEATYPSAKYAWGMVLILTLAYISSFIDRYIFGLLAQQIKVDLSLTDTQIGMVGGLAFASFYATSGIFLGWLADHRRRTYIVGIGIIVWSIATALSGLAKSYWQLFLARVGVGAGEATLSPCAMSMIADSFPPHKRGKPIAVYTSALVLGAGFANLLSAAIIDWTIRSPSVAIPLVGDLAPWQLTFLIVGLPGLLIAIPFFLIREPTRQAVADSEAGLKGGHLLDTLGYMRKRWGAFVGMTLFVCAMTVTAYSQSTWMPATFERTWGWSSQLYGTVNGITILTISPVTIWVTGWAVDKWRASGRRDAPYLLLVIGTLLMVPTGAIAPLMPTGVSAFGVLVFNTVGIGIVSCVGVTALLQLTPGKVRAQIVALYYMAISLTGAIIGPVGVGMLSDNVFGEENLRYAMALMALLVGLITIIGARAGRRAYLRQMDRLEGGH